MMSHQIFGRQARQPQLLAGRNGFGRAAEFVSVSRLDLDENQRFPVARDDVDFAAANTVAAGDDAVATLFELTTRQIFARDAHADSRVRHTGASKQSAGLKARAYTWDRGRQLPAYFRF